MASSPDLFVVCSNCGSEVSPYITECPYCGTRLRKRAPKIERDGTVSEPTPKKPKPKKERKPPRERPPREERAGVGARLGTRPYATLALVTLSLFGYLALAVVGRGDIAVAGPIDGEWWRVVTSPFVYGSAWYELAAVTAVGIYGWLLERRHGFFAVLALFLICGAGGIALTAAIDPAPLAIGGNGAALGLLCAWAVPDLLARARGQEYDGDLLGTLVLALVVLLMPLATPEASAIAGLAGGAIGLLAGLALARGRSA
jgi:membrane associated rhomboid family serine protease/DNA-directed RNA polymerase subunit RPC12/RpoP